MVVFAAVALTVLVAIAGLAVDGARGRAAQVQGETAADAASLAVAGAWNNELTTGAYEGQNSGGPAYPDAAVDQAPLVATLNGVGVSQADSCIRSQGSAAQQLDVVFYDVAGAVPPACAPPSGWGGSVEVQVPVYPTLGTCQTNEQENGCVEVTTRRVQVNLVGGILGIRTTTVAAVAVASPDELQPSQ